MSKISRPLALGKSVLDFCRPTIYIYMYIHTESERGGWEERKRENERKLDEPYIENEGDG